MGPRGATTTIATLVALARHGGRGAGKTRTGAEWVRATALGHAWTGSTALSPIALVGRDYDDARSVMVEGTSGLLAVHPPGERPVWHASRRLLEWPNGAIGQVFSATSFEALRGPQFAAAWCDEIAKWRYAQEAFDQLQFALRQGPHPRQLITTTPRATAFMRALVARDDIVLTGMKSADNAAHLAPGFIDGLTARYGGTRLGRQEIDGELIADRDDSLFPRLLMLGNLGSGITSAELDIRCHNGTTQSYAGTEQSLYAWGVKAEQASTPTPYNPDDTGHWFNLDRGANIIEFVVPPTSSGFDIIKTFDDGTNDNRLTLFRHSDGTFYFEVRVDGVVTATPSLGAATPGEIARVAISYDTNDVRACMNGVLATPDTSATLPSGISTMRYGRIAGGLDSDIIVRRDLYFPSSFADPQLQALTSGGS